MKMNWQERFSLRVAILFLQDSICRYGFIHTHTYVCTYIHTYMHIYIGKKAETKFILEVVLLRVCPNENFIFFVNSYILVFKIYVIYNSTTLNYFLFKMKDMPLVDLKDYLTYERENKNKTYCFICLKSCFM